MWAEDAKQMVQTGISWVRIGEFAWSRMEPQPGVFEFDWLDRAIDVLASAGLNIILGTPTCTPPRWMVDRYPDMIALDVDGKPRGFGARRHYCFSHEAYRTESVRIAEILGDRYGRDERIKAWQIDNEYGCHDTTLSYSDAARQAFRGWLQAHYQSVDRLNTLWGNVFWSMEMARFEDIDLPNMTVTEPNPAHVMAFRRFSSDQVVSFNRLQADILRKYSDAPLIHNYMGRITEFDHYDVGADLDIASWDSYPLGFLSDRLEADEAHKAAFLRQGDPDMQAFHHDLYRRVGRGRWWIMEQQPGPVNWAPYNPAPLPGMARLWAWEAFAHGAETVCYFRWRQAPFAQEQMHAGLLRPDNADAPALGEARQVADELRRMPEVGTARAQVALVFDYPSNWAWDTQPQGADFDYFRLSFAYYKALRRAGLNIDFIPAEPEALAGYDLVLAPGLMHVSESFGEALASFGGCAVLGPRSGSKTPEMSIPVPMGPGLPGFDLTITRVESLPPSVSLPLKGGGVFRHWAEDSEGAAEVLDYMEDGRPALLRSGGLHYVTGWPDDEALDRIVATLCDAAGLSRTPVSGGLRIRDTDTHRFVFNYGAEAAKFDGHDIAPAGVMWLPL